MKRRLFKFLLGLIRALVLGKRFLVWLLRMIGSFFVWLSKLAFPYLVVPLYNQSRHWLRRYREVSENPWERRRIVFASRPVVLVVLMLFLLTTARLAVAASNQSGFLPGSRSLLVASLLPSEEDIDWQWEDATVGTGEAVEVVEEDLGQVIYHDGGAVAYVFPFSEQKTELPTNLAGQPTDTTMVAPVQKYVVQRGDSLAKIAARFGLKVETLLWANKLTTRTILRAGDVLTVPAKDGVVYMAKSGDTLSKIGGQYGVKAADIAATNNLSAAATLKKGQLLLLPGARQLAVATPPKPAAPAPTPTAVEPTPEPEPALAIETPSEEFTSPDVIVVDVSSYSRPPLAAGEKMLWPSNQRGLTQYFSSRHPGLDVNGDYSDKIYATDDGVVVSSGWNNSGYGNMILIDHGNGYKSRYAHCSKVYVKAGQLVSKGDVIAMIGTTGRSTGTHLHFEIYLNGRRVNPLKYVR